MRDQRRQDDGAQALGHDIAEEEIERGHEQHQYKQLPQLHADIERQQRRQDVGAGELQRVAQDEGKAESMHQAEEEGDDPAPGRMFDHDILQRHINDRDRDQGFDQGREPPHIRSIAIGRGDQGNGMGHREGGDDGNQGANAAERNDQAEQEEQMIDAFQDVMKAHHHEAACGVVPVGIQRHLPGIAFQRIGPRDAAGRVEFQARHFMQRQPVEGGVHRKIGILRLNGVVE